MRNYRTLTTDEINELERLYPVTTNRELSRRFNISVDALQDFVAYPRGWKKDFNAVVIGNRGGRSLNEKEIAWIVKHYKHTKNEDIMQRFGIGESTLHRTARKYGLKKSPQQMKKMQAGAAEAARQACTEYGVYQATAERMRKVMSSYKERGERLPDSFAPGESNKDRLTPERFRKCMEKIHRKRNETIRRDRARLVFGLPQKSKLRLSVCDPKMQRRRAYYRWLLVRRNYIVERGATTIYYDEETDRDEDLEQRATTKAGLHFVSDMPDEPQEAPQYQPRTYFPPRQFETW